MSHVGESFIEIHPSTAEHYGVDDGDYVRVHSRRGDIVVKAQVTERISEGTLFIPMHFAAGAVNKLTQETFDPTPVSPNTGCQASPSRHSARTLGRTCCGRPMPEPAAELRTGTAETGVVCPAVGSWPPPLERIPCDNIGREGCHRVCRGDVDLAHAVPDSQGRPRSWRHSLSQPM